MMQYNAPLIWQKMPIDLHGQLMACADKARNMRGSHQRVRVFFRADDVAAPGKDFSRLIALFRQYRVPLSMAVVPAWLTCQRRDALFQITGPDRALWCWHQHGWRHMNHESAGKKQEFGPSRSRVDLGRDLKKGCRRLAALLEDRFDPVFTPPWNRCDEKTLALLAHLGFRAVSRSLGSRPVTLPGLPDFQMGVDLHTRKDDDVQQGWINLMEDLNRALASGVCGIMIHHQRMNHAAFEGLEQILKLVRSRKEMDLVHFRDMAAAI